MNKAKKIFAGMLAGVMALSFAACSGGKAADKTDTTAAPAQKTDITVCLDWTPNTNHTGMFVAKEKGYYEAAGLNVSIVQPPDNSTATQLCSSNKAQFAIDAQDTLAPAFTSDTPMDVTAVAALLQHNSSGIISKAGQGMDRPKGLTGNTYLTWDSPIEKAMMEISSTRTAAIGARLSRSPTRRPPRRRMCSRTRTTPFGYSTAGAVSTPRSTKSM